MKTVIHAKGTTEEGHNWIKEWEDATSLELPSNCPCCGDEPTEENYLVGAHVKLLNDLPIPTSESRLFITPTCKMCNDKFKNSNAELKAFTVEDDYLWEVTDE